MATRTPELEQASQRLEDAGSSQLSAIHGTANAALNAQDTLSEIVSSTRGSMMTTRLSQEQREDLQAILDALKVWGEASNTALVAVGEYAKAKRIADKEGA